MVNDELQQRPDLQNFNPVSTTTADTIYLIQDYNYNHHGKYSRYSFIHSFGKSGFKAVLLKIVYIIEYKLDKLLSNLICQS